MQVHALKIQEVPGISGGTETQIAVEAETIFDVSPGGLYYANLVVTGVPVVPPTKQAWRRSPDMCRYNIIIGAGRGIGREAIH